MTIYIPDYDSRKIIEKEFEGIANLQQFYNDLNELYDEWYEAIEDAEEALWESFEEE